MITSVQNNKVKQWNKLKKKKDREQANVFLIEGFHLVQEANNSDFVIDELIIEEGVEVPSWITNIQVTEVSTNVFQSLSNTVTPQGIAAVVHMKENKITNDNKLLLIDAVQDPGNLGTMIRTADAAGFDGVILGDGTVDLYNEKVIRATQGSIFHLPIIRQNLKESIINYRDKGVTIWASTLTDAAVPYHSLPVPKTIGLIVGNEGAGISQEYIEMADHLVHIPIYGLAESLNVGIASGILLYHIASMQENKS
ncbi:TrmH family RNA methyltransferase [Aquibacillus salsiterrae]|uniref:RNA methyltransferase n=1 Tax=Aquibacillus salsiterrae TaxID=2950439 RepID=A0A9X4AEZ9_9BACI|nr:RNA methyltransferase [Aquibacillus salsiterrae]MDC3415720.1 RNA methyltransferase [Aquibacillus salsiterrae]